MTWPTVVWMFVLVDMYNQLALNKISCYKTSYNNRLNNFLCKDEQFINFR